MSKLLIFIFSFLCATLLLNEAVNGVAAFSTRVYLTSTSIQIFSIYNIFVKEKILYSLNKIFYLFSLFFFGISPLIQYYNNISFWGMRQLNEFEYFYMNIIILLILIGYQLLYNYFYKMKISNKSYLYVQRFSLNNKLSSSQTARLLLCAFFSFIVLFYSSNFNILNLLIREFEFSESGSSLALGLIIYRFVRPLSMMCLLYYLCFKSNSKRIFILLFLVAIFTCFPTGMPRFSAAAIYIPLLLFLPFFKKKHAFSILFIAGLLLIFPFLDNFRYFSQGKKMMFGFDFNMFLSENFDNYQNFAFIIFNNIVTWGRQLIGAMFFAVPRSIWPDKPIGSGAYIAETFNLNFTNISANYFAEGYINFGISGVILFILILAYFTAKMDKLYWTVFFDKTNNSFKIIYFLLFGMTFFILRGDLMSSFAYTVGLLLAVWVVFKLINSKKNE